MSSRMDWEGAARRDQLRPDFDRPLPKRQPPSSKQLSYLKALAKRADAPTPKPRTRAEASLEIERLKAFLGRTSLGRSLPMPPRRKKGAGRHRRSQTPYPG